MDGADALRIEAIGGLAGIDAAAWDACANPLDGPYDPFVSWAFLEALESSGCVGADAGWRPLHLAARTNGAVVGVMPLYVKDHSYGEYVFDHAWADALMRAGGRYYPKLQCAVPFTPVTGRRIMAPAPSTRRALAAGALDVLRRIGASSLHVTFADGAQAEELAALGLLRRTGVQFHWTNPGYANFEDFLAALTAQKRKTIRRERARACEGLTIHRRTGADISERDWDFFFACYMHTGSRKWGSPYLNREVFSRIGARMADQVLLIIAEAQGAPIAAALNFIGSNALYGRYWGAVSHRDFLHFELCYYQAIDYAIEHKLARVEAGAQGEHKLARGYAPVATHSAHWIAHAGLRDAVARYLENETPAMAEEIEQLAAHTPFRHDL